MNSFILRSALTIIQAIFIIFTYQNNVHSEQFNHLKFVTEEAAAGAAQFLSLDKYGEGYVVFNKSEGIKAVEEIIKSNLKLDDNLAPTDKTYWVSNKVKYDVVFFDDDNSTFPKVYDYTLPDGKQKEFIINGPSVIVSISPGKPKYTLFHADENYRVAMYTLE